MSEITFSGPSGRIEARYKKQSMPTAPIIIFFHPHPEHGGTMNNRIIYTMFHTFAKRGFTCLRFNFRGIGKSQGAFSGGDGELVDAACALDWLQDNNELSEDVWVAGFSFGAWIAMQILMRRPEVKQFVCVAPPTTMFDFSFLAPCPTGGLILQGEDDKIAPAQETQKLVEKLQTQSKSEIAYHCLKGADHFFTGQENLLVEYIEEYIERQHDEDLLPL